MWNIFIIALMLFSGAVKASIPVNSLFDGYNYQEIPIRYCNLNGRNGVIRKLPALPDCLPPKPKMNSTVTLLTTFVIDETDQMISGTECYIKTYTNVVTPTLMGLEKALLHYQHEKYNKMSAKECRDLVATKRTPAGEQLQDLGAGMLGTNNNEIPAAKWWFDAKKENTNYYALKIWISVSGSYIKPIGTAIKSECGIEEGECLTRNGILVWEKNDHKTCNILQGRITPCLRTGNF